MAKAESLNLAQVNKIANLKATLEACKEKWHNTGFADAEGSMEPIVYQARKHGFKKRWMAALQAMEVPADSLLRNPEQIPFLEPLPPT